VEHNKISPKKVWIKCQEKEYHGSYLMSCSMFSKGSRCPICASKIIHKLDSLGGLYPKVFNVWSDLNNVSPYELAPMTNKNVYFSCENGIHSDYKRKVYRGVELDFRCPECAKERNQSRLQEKVKSYFESLGYFINTELSCSIVPINSKNKRPLPFDNEVIELNVL
jgi:hypothetical protein